MDIRKRLVGFVKYSKPVYFCYFYFGTGLLRLLKLFVKPKKNVILFIAYGGKKYDDSPKCIYEAMLKDKRFDLFEFVWAFNDPYKFEIPRGRKIKTDTLNYYICALQARCWITNSGVERGLSFKGKYTFYFNTWHGIPFKKMGVDITEKNVSFHSKSTTSCVDVMLASGEYDAKLYPRVFKMKEECIRIVGMPRNDELVSYGRDKNYIDRIKESLKIPRDKKIILYAPTFREYEKTADKKCCFNIPIHIDQWEKLLSKEYVVLFRAHYEVARTMNIRNNSFIRDVSSYSSLNDLMIISDLLVSDYSSILFDYSIMGKPLFCFIYDFDVYMRERGLYLEVYKDLSDSIISSEEQLLDAILHLDCNESTRQVINFRDKYVREYGAATQQSLNILIQNIIPL